MLIVVAGLKGAISCGAQAPQPVSGVILPLDRTAYFIGETVPLALSGGGACKLEAVNASGRTLLYEGKPDAVWLDTSKLAPGDYTLELKDARDRLIIKYY